MQPVPKVLIIDPRDLLKSLGNTVVSRSNIVRVYANELDSALEAISQLAPHLVILSSHESQEGLDAVKRLRTVPTDHSMEIIVLDSAFVDPTEKGDYLAAGADAVLPVDTDSQFRENRFRRALRVPARRGPQVSVDTPVEIFPYPKSLGACEPNRGRAVNIGLGGMRLRTPGPLILDSRLNLRFSLPGSEGPLKTLGRVARLSSSTQGPFEAGIEFLVHHDDTRARIESFVSLAIPKSKYRLPQSLSSSPHGIALLDQDGRVLDLNPQWLRLFGYAYSDVINRRIDSEIVPRNHRIGADEFSRLAQGEEARIAETERTRKDGTLVAVSILSLPLDLDEATTGRLVLYRNLSQEKTAERTLRTAREALEGRFREARDQETPSPPATSQTQQPVPTEVGRVHSTGTKNTSSKAPNPSHRLRILLVEDDIVNQTVTRAMLTRLGHEAEVASDGCEAIEAIEAHSFDCVLMDLRLPDMSGIETTRRIRRMWPNGGPQVIAMTGGVYGGEREQCLEAGMNDYLEKPFKLEKLASLLSRVAPRPNPS